MSKQEIVEAIKALEDKDGGVTPDAVVEAARDPESPLHDRFEWDDAKAAAQQRIATARRLIVSVKLSVRYQKVSVRAPVYTRDPSAAKGEQGYRNVMRLRSEPDEAHAALVAEMSRVSSILRRARSLAVVLGQVDHLDAIETQVSDFIGELEERTPEAAAA